MLVHSLLEQTSRRYPDKPAVWYRDQWMSYGEIETQATQVAQFLITQGLQRGERVTLLMENSFTFITSYFGILKAGGVVVGLNTEITSEDLEYLVHNSEARFLLINKERLRLYEPVKERLPSLHTVVVSDDTPHNTAPGENKGEAPAEIVSTATGFISFQSILEEYTGAAYGESTNPAAGGPIDLDLAEIVYTSGSTGVPKGVMLSHLNLTSNMQSIAEYLHLCPEDRIMVILPFTYIYGKSLLLTHFLVGGSLVIDNRFVYPNKVLQTMQQTAVTGFAGVPSTFSILLNRSSLKNYTFPNLRYVTQAGGHMAPALQKEVVEAFYPAMLYVMYGATEAAPRLSYLEPSMLLRKLGSIGTPVPNVDLFVANEEGEQVPVGEEGEIAARGSNIMQGYWKDPKGTSEVLKHGLYFTGDLGTQDEEGYLYVVGRKKNIIKVKGFRVSAKEIEERILEIEGVVETAVIGVPDEVLGEAVKAFIVAREGVQLTEQTVLAYLKPHLSSYKLPKQIEFRDFLPKNKSGKIMKTALSEK